MSDEVQTTVTVKLLVPILAMVRAEDGSVAPAQPEQRIESVTLRRLKARDMRAWNARPAGSPTDETTFGYWAAARMGGLSDETFDELDLVDMNAIIAAANSLGKGHQETGSTSSE